MKLWFSLWIGAAIWVGPGRAQSAPAASAAAASDSIVNGVVAIVGDEVITRKELFEYLDNTVNLLMDRYRYQPDVLRREVAKVTSDGLEQLIERKLILQEYKTAGYGLPESVFQDEIQRRINEQFGDRVSAVRTLEQRGLTLEQFKQQVREDLIITLMRQFKVSDSKIIISPHRIEKYYAEHLEDFKVGNEYKLRTIMINRSGKESPAAARKLADEILAKLKDGAGFAEMAEIYSEDTFRGKGGDRGWIELEKEHYQKPLEDAIRSLQSGQCSGVIEAGDTFWIVQVEQVKPSHYKTLSEVRSDIEATLKVQERNRLQKQWVNRLRAKSFVRYF
jgi:peptidyl-prolyl cis-trans isomerase SurA